MGKKEGGLTFGRILCLKYGVGSYFRWDVGKVKVKSVYEPSGQSGRSLSQFP